MNRLFFPGLMLAVLLALPSLADAQAAVPALTATPGPDGSQTWSFNIETLVLLTMLSFLPAMLLMMTGFTRIIIVLSLLRTAMGTNTSPPNSVLIGLALFLTFYAMSPVFDQVYDLAYAPLSAGTINFQQALELGSGPMRTFMLEQTREADLLMFANMAELPRSEERRVGKECRYSIETHLTIDKWNASSVHTLLQ